MAFESFTQSEKCNHCTVRNCLQDDDIEKRLVFDEEWNPLEAIDDTIYECRSQFKYIYEKNI